MNIHHISWSWYSVPQAFAKHIILYHSHTTDILFDCHKSTSPRHSTTFRTEKPWLVKPGGFRRGSGQERRGRSYVSTEKSMAILVIGKKNVGKNLGKLAKTLEKHGKTLNTWKIKLSTGHFWSSLLIGSNWPYQTSNRKHWTLHLSITFYSTIYQNDQRLFTYPDGRHIILGTAENQSFLRRFPQASSRSSRMSDDPSARRPRKTSMLSVDADVGFKQMDMNIIL